MPAHPSSRIRSRWRPDHTRASPPPPYAVSLAGRLEHASAQVATPSCTWRRQCDYRTDASALSSTAVIIGDRAGLGRHSAPLGHSVPLLCRLLSMHVHPRRDGKRERASERERYSAAAAQVLARNWARRNRLICTLHPTTKTFSACEHGLAEYANLPTHTRGPVQVPHHPTVHPVTTRRVLTRVHDAALYPRSSTH